MGSAQARFTAASPHRRLSGAAAQGMDAREQLCELGIRPTMRRVEVIDLLRASRLMGRDGVTPAVLHDRARASGSTIGIAAIYAALAVMVDVGLVERHRAAHLHEAWNFSLKDDATPALRLVCVACGAAQTVSDPVLAERMRALAAARGIGMGGMAMSLQGRCKTCASAVPVGRHRQGLPRAYFNFPGNF